MKSELRLKAEKLLEDFTPSQVAANLGNDIFIYTNYLILGNSCYICIIIQSYDSQFQKHLRPT